MSKPITNVIGREEHMTQLQQIMSGAISARLLSVEAPRGMGKSHLLRHMANKGRADGYVIVLIDLAHAQELDSLYLIRHIRDQLHAQCDDSADAFLLLNQTINRHARSNEAFVSIVIDESLQTVRVNKIDLLESLLQLTLPQIEQLLFDLCIDPPSGNPSKRQLTERLLGSAIQLDLLSDLVTVANDLEPGFGWWSAVVSDGHDTIDQQGELRLDDRLARQQALVEISSALLLGIDALSEKRPILWLVDAWEQGGQAACAWLLRWLITPIVLGELDGIGLVIAGRNLSNVSTISNRAIHTTLPPFTQSQTRDLLIEHLGFSPDIDAEAIFEWTKGIPNVLTTLVAVNQLQERG